MAFEGKIQTLSQQETKRSGPSKISACPTRVSEMDVFPMFALFPWLFLIVYLLFLYLDV